MANCNSNQREHSMYHNNSDCALENMPLAMAYIPWQHFDNVYEIDKALNYGTIFPELNKPFYGKRGVRG